MSKGTIAGMFFNYEAAKSFQIAESVKTVTPVEASAGTFALVMNAEKYKSLPDDLRKLIDDTTGPSAARRVGAIYDEAEDEGRQYLLAAKVDILELTASERGVFEDAATPLVGTFLAKAEAKGIKAKAFYEQIRAAVGAK